jgi:hypothetical protein
MKKNHCELVFGERDDDKLLSYMIHLPGGKVVTGKTTQSKKYIKDQVKKINKRLSQEVSLKAQICTRGF